MRSWPACWSRSPRPPRRPGYSAIGFGRVRVAGHALAARVGLRRRGRQLGQRPGTAHLGHDQFTHPQRLGPGRTAPVRFTRLVCRHRGLLRLRLDESLRYGPAAPRMGRTGPGRRHAWGDAERLATAWRVFDTSAAARDTSAGVSARLTDLCQRLCPVQRGAIPDAAAKSSAAVERLLHRWGGDLPMLGRFTEADLYDLVCRAGGAR